MGQTCKNCGRAMPLGWETRSFCMTCSTEVRRDKAAQLREKGAELREKKGEQPPAPGLIGEYPGKHRCDKCGHSYKLDNTSIRACNYIVDKEEFTLPPRPRPSADPNHCLYWAKSPSKAGWFTEAEKREMYSKRSKPVLDMSTCTIYRSVGTASALLGIPNTEIKKECDSTDDINAPRRWRFLKPEEIELIKPMEV